MIKIDETQLEMRGDFGTLMTEVTNVLRELCNSYGRGTVMPAFISAMYTIPEKTGDKVDLTKSLDNFGKDTKLALKFMEHVCTMKGETLAEKWMNKMKGDLFKDE